MENGICKYSIEVLLNLCGCEVRQVCRVKVLNIYQVLVYTSVIMTFIKIDS